MSAPSWRQAQSAGGHASSGPRRRWLPRSWLYLCGNVISNQLHSRPLGDIPAQQSDVCKSLSAGGRQLNTPHLMCPQPPPPPSPPHLRPSLMNSASSVKASSMPWKPAANIGSSTGFSVPGCSLPHLQCTRETGGSRQQGELKASATSVLLCPAGSESIQALRTGREETN